MVEKSLVCRIEQTSQEKDSFACRPIPNSERSNLFRAVKLGEFPLRVDFIRHCLSLNNIDDGTVFYILHSIRKSTQYQYQIVWASWLSFLSNSVDNDLSINLFCNYLKFLFEAKCLKVHTIITYKSALLYPFYLGFNFDINNNIVTKCIKGMSLLRPDVPFRCPDWELSKVLNYLVISFPNCKNDIYFNAKRTLFLLALALGSRVGELFALKRSNIKLLSNGSLRIFPDPLFLFKNENPLNRRAAVTIDPLRARSKTLCPVAAVQHYLKLTEKSVCGDLFVHPVSLAKWNLSGVRLAICRLIKQSQPDSLPKCHDIRKMASSLAFFTHMDFSEIASLTGWRSIKVFYKHYLKNIKECQNRCIILNRSSV